MRSCLEQGRAPDLVTWSRARRAVAIYAAAHLGEPGRDVNGGAHPKRMIRASSARIKPAQLMIRLGGAGAAGWRAWGAALPHSRPEGKLKAEGGRGAASVIPRARRQAQLHL